MTKKEGRIKETANLKKTKSIALDSSSEFDGVRTRAQREKEQIIKKLQNELNAYEAYEKAKGNIENKNNAKNLNLENKCSDLESQVARK